jgi:hypothetical protein
MSLYNALLPGSALPAGKKLKVQEFLTSSNWVRPAGVDTVEVLLVGGGGGGGGISYSGASALLTSGSGGGGGVVEKLLNVTSVSVGASVLVTIGAGGAGGSTAGTAGGVGGNSSFGSLLTALGGGGGDGLPTASGVTSGIATQGGGAHQSTVNPSHISVWLGGGAGGAANPQYSGSALNNEYGVPSSSVITPNYRYYSANSAPILAAPGVMGYGAGGGFNIVPSSLGAGGGSVANALSNSGGGGAGCRVNTSTSATLAGGAGGSGYALISWWE